MKLIEIFNAPSEYRQKSTSEYIDTYNFTTKNNIEIDVQIFKLPDFRKGGINIKAPGIGFSFKNMTKGGTEAITGTGDEVEIFSTVLRIIETNIKKYNPEIIAFGAHEKSRQSLYERIIRFMQRKYDYELLENVSIDFQLGDSKYYVLRKR